jgi:voltage-gated potassium channel Kch
MIMGAMPHTPTLKQKWQYFFDNVMSGGAAAMIGMLALMTLVIIGVTAVMVSLGGQVLAPQDSGGVSFVEAAWKSLMHAMDAGTVGGDEGWGFRLVMFLLPTLGGVFIFSSLIGVLSTAVQGRLDELRKGRSLVLEHNHTVILGWSPQVFTIISEIVEANANQKKPAIAILAGKDKVEMEDEIRAHVSDTKNTRIICRSGSPIDPSDLELVSPHAARSIVIVSPEDDDPDPFVIKSVLAITNNPNRRDTPYHIVTQVRDVKNMQVIQMLGARDTVSAVLTEDIIARVTAQTSRQSGLSVVYTELLNFGGDEIYFTEEQAFVGRTYAETLRAYEDSAVIGLLPAGGQAQLNPAMDTRLTAGDKLILIAADDDTIKPSGLAIPPVREDVMRTSAQVPVTKPERALILGWNRCAATILRELDNYVAPESTASVVADETFEADVRACGTLANQTVTFHPGDTSDRTLLDTLQIADYDHVIVLADTTRPVQEADGRTLVTLLHLRDIASRDDTPFSIVSEMLDLRNRVLAEVTKVDDFIVSDHLVSLMMAQLSENSDLMPVFGDMFDPEGSEIYLEPAEHYVAIGEPVSFYTVLEAARRRGQTAFGYRINAEHGAADRSYGVHTNPRKSELITFAADDKIIVLAE